MSHTDDLKAAVALTNNDDFIAAMMDIQTKAQATYTIDEIPVGAVFTIPASAEEVLYTMGPDRSVSADRLVTLSADEARMSFRFERLSVRA